MSNVLVSDSEFQMNSVHCTVDIQYLSSQWTMKYKSDTQAQRVLDFALNGQEPMREKLEGSNIKKDHSYKLKIYLLYVILYHILPLNMLYSNFLSDTDNRQTRYREAQFFSYILGNYKWNATASHCGETTIILYSEQDGVVRGYYEYMFRNTEDSFMMDILLSSNYIYLHKCYVINRIYFTISYSDSESIKVKE